MSNPYNQKRNLKFATLLIALIIAILFLFTFVLANQAPVNKSSDEMFLDLLRTEYARDPSPNAQMRKSLEEKIAILEKEITERAQITPPTRDPNKTPKFVPWTPPPFTTGIFEGQVGGYFHGWEAKIENSWKGIVNGNYVMIFAGEWVKDPGQGFVAVSTTSPDLRKTVWSFYPSSTKSGALRIKDAMGNILVIQSAAGDRLYFHILAQQYVSTLTDNPPAKNPFLINTSTPAFPPYP